jgi:hypothetical protein
MEENLNLWVMDNFWTIHNYGDLQVSFTPEELLEAKQILKSRSELNKLKVDDKVCLFEAVAAYIHNVKDELIKRENIKPVKKGQILKAENFETEEDKIIIYRGSKKRKPPKVDSNLDPIFTEAAQNISNSLNKFQHKNKRIPELAYRVAYEVDFYLKKLMPEITTDSIITKLYKAVGLVGYDKINHINLYIQRGKEASQNFI